MRNRKKGLALLLLVVMLTGLLAVPASAAGAPYIRQVEAGKWTSWAVTSTGDLYGWGKCSTAELFNGKTGSDLPVKLMSGVKSVSASSVEIQPTFEVRKYDDYGYIAYVGTVNLEELMADAPAEVYQRKQDLQMGGMT